MGKRKTATRKKQINKAAKGLAKSFARKLGVSAGQNATKSAKTAFVALASRPEKARKHNKMKKALSTEDKEFRREQTSLNERSRLLEKNKNAPAKNPFQFHPARFAASDDQKSTALLIAEAEQKVQELQGIGGQRHTLLNEASAVFPRGSSLKRSAGLSWTDAADVSQPASHNPWEILGNGDEEEASNSAENKTSRLSFAPPMFQFAPASFIVRGSEEIDPDL